MGATPPPPYNRPVTVGPTNPPPSTSREHECWVPHPLDTHPKEGEGKEGVGSGKREEKRRKEEGEGR